MWNRAQAVSAIEALDLVGPNREIAAYWLSLWKGDRPPGRGQFNAARVREFLPGIALFEVHPGEGIRCRLAGTAFRHRFGFEIAGHDWLALTPEAEKATRLERNSGIALGAVSCGWRIDPMRNGRAAQFQDVQLPFPEIGEDGARFYLHHSNWRPLASAVLPLHGETPRPIGVAQEFMALSLY